MQIYLFSCTKNYRHDNSNFCVYYAPLQFCISFVEQMKFKIGKKATHRKTDRPRHWVCFWEFKIKRKCFVRCFCLFYLCFRSSFTRSQVVSASDFFWMWVNKNGVSSKECDSSRWNHSQVTDKIQIALAVRKIHFELQSCYFAAKSSETYQRKSSKKKP